LDGRIATDIQVNPYLSLFTSHISTTYIADQKKLPSKLSRCNIKSTIIPTRTGSIKTRKSVLTVMTKHINNIQSIGHLHNIPFKH
jgi:hypothetical protein